MQAPWSSAHSEMLETWNDQNLKQLRMFQMQVQKDHAHCSLFEQLEMFENECKSSAHSEMFQTSRSFEKCSRAFETIKNGSNPIRKDAWSSVDSKMFETWRTF